MAISDTEREGGQDHSDEQLGSPDHAAESTFEENAAFEQPAQLALGDDVRLPWLEGDDEDGEDERGSGFGQGMLLVLLGLVAIGVIVGGLFWATRKKGDEQLVADGGVIAAPKQPYKVKPANPGGEVVAGTGDTSFAVAEGKSSQVQIDGKDQASGDETPKPGFDTAAKPGPKSSGSVAPAASPSTAPVTGVGVQVGAYSSKDAAEAGWNALKTQYSGLSGVSHRVLQGQADIGIVYRLQAVPGDLAAARALCNGMKNAGLSCQVKN